MIPSFLENKGRLQRSRPFKERSNEKLIKILSIPTSLFYRTIFNV